MLDLSKMYTYGTVNSIFVEIQPDSTDIKMTLVFSLHIYDVAYMTRSYFRHLRQAANVMDNAGAWVSEMGWVSEIWTEICTSMTFYTPHTLVALNTLVTTTY